MQLLPPSGGFIPCFLPPASDVLVVMVDNACGEAKVARFTNAGAK